MKNKGKRTERGPDVVDAKESTSMIMTPIRATYMDGGRAKVVISRQYPKYETENAEITDRGDRGTDFSTAFNLAVYPRTIR